jgi:hypothetical protein
MTNPNLHAPAQSSRFFEPIAGLFMAAAVIVSGFVSLAMFAG